MFRFLLQAHLAATTSRTSSKVSSDFPIVVKISSLRAEISGASKPSAKYFSNLVKEKKNSLKTIELAKGVSC